MDFNKILRNEEIPIPLYPPSLKGKGKLFLSPHPISGEGLGETAGTATEWL